MLLAEQSGDPLLPLFVTSLVLSALSITLLRMVGGYFAVLRARIGRSAPLHGGDHVRHDPTAEWRSLVGPAKVQFYGASIMTPTALATGVLLLVRSI
jgi:hypothetical protein